MTDEYTLYAIHSRYRPRAEPIRMIFHYGKQPFKDVHVDASEFGAMKDSKFSDADSYCCIQSWSHLAKLSHLVSQPKNEKSLRQQEIFFASLLYALKAKHNLRQISLEIANIA